MISLTVGQLGSDVLVGTVMAQASMEMLAGVQIALMDLMKVNSAVIMVPMVTVQTYMVVMMYSIVV